ncbi:MAG: phosphotransferase [Nocardiopsaceae bacterium]|jgi:O-antigen/teichoic acid export membrane protein|nr:phosphotransferase [Nocardiopsaceae bacterium]
MTTAKFVVEPQRRLAGSWRYSLAGTGHLLVVNSIFNAGTGLGYWLLSARLNSPAIMGTNSAAISAMMLLAGIAQLNLMSAILRFVPTAGAAGGPMIRTAYIIGGGLSGVAAAVFVLGLRFWAPHLSGLIGTGLGAAGFVLATMCWSLFVMQDNALIAVRRPAAVPVENLTFAVLKIVLVVVLSLAMPGAGIWRSWTAAMIITVAGTTVYLFRRAVPSFASQRPLATVDVASARDLTRFIGPDYVGAVAYIAGTSLVPLLVLDLTSPRQSAAFALAWSICTALYQVPIAFGQSLVAHGATHTERLAAYHRQALRQALRLLVPVVVLVVAFAPFGLHFFGPWYPGHGTLTLRLLALSSLPNAIVALAVSRARVARRMTHVVVTLVGLSGLVVCLTVVLVPRLGIVGAGIAWLGAQLVVAAGLLVHGQLSALRARWAGPGSAGVPAAVMRAALAGGGWQPEQSLPTVSDSAVIMIRAADGGSGVLKLATSSCGVTSLQREHEVLRRLQSDERLGEWRALLPGPLGAGTTDGAGYLVTTRLPGQDGRQAMAELGSWLTPAAINAIAPLHRVDSATHVVNAALLRQLVDEPAELVRNAVRRKESVERLVAALHAELAGRWVTLGWTHGDFHPGNVLVSNKSQVTGIVDWGQAREQDLTVLDIAFWLLTVPRPSEPRELGARVAARLGRGPCWQPAESRLLTARMYGNPVSGQALLLLAWLRHVADNLAKSGRYTTSPVWGRRNILPVLRWADDPGQATELSA